MALRSLVSGLLLASASALSVAPTPTRARPKSTPTVRHGSERDGVDFLQRSFEDGGTKIYVATVASPGAFAVFEVMSDDCESCASGKWPAYGADEQPDYENLNDLIDEVAAKYPGEQLRIRQKDLPRLMLKRLTVKRMLSNLITNALKYGAAPVEIDTALDDNALVLVVRDHGKGVREEDIPLLLQPFSRGEKARTLSGSGLGLAIVKRIVDMHHGEMALDNHPHGGLRVTIRFPLTGQLVQPETLSAGVR